jgi:hypothetical protein
MSTPGFLENGQPCGDEGDTCGICYDCKSWVAYVDSYAEAARADFAAREDLGLPSDATDLEVMEAAQKVRS